MMLYCAFVMAGLPHHYSQPSAAPGHGDSKEYDKAIKDAGLVLDHIKSYIQISHNNSLSVDVIIANHNNHDYNCIIQVLSYDKALSMKVYVC